MNGTYKIKLLKQRQLTLSLLNLLRMKALFIFISLLMSFVLNTVCQTKKDSTLVLQSDDYSNSKHKDISTNTMIYPITEREGHDTAKISSFKGSYEEAIKLAELYFQKSKYEIAVAYYQTAFKSNKDLGKVKDRYKAACAYAALKNNDSAFAHLFKIVKGTRYYDIPKLENEFFFLQLKKDKRWKELIILMEENIKKITEEANPNN
jgi:tetratricopeptide (TPR) repeat protein